MQEHSSEIDRSRGPELLRRVHGSDRLLWLAFLLAHVVPIVAGASLVRDNGFGDLHLYKEWMDQGLDGGGWPVIDEAWVYPIGAVLPMILLAPLQGATAYLLGWFLLTLLLNLLVLVMIEEHERPSRTASWWWVLAITTLGPVALSRLESVMVPVAVIAVLVLPRRPALASALLTLAGWIKVVPMVWLIPLVLSDAKKTGRMIASSVAVSAAMIVPAWLLGGGSRIFSFLTVQTDRGLQIESVPASAIQAARLWGGGATPTYSTEIITWQFDGNAADAIGRVATVLTLPAVLAVLLLIGRAMRRAPERRLEILAAGLLSTTLALIVFNKVGSPQYLAWLSAAVVLGLLSRRGDQRLWLRWAAVALLMNAMTQAIYPHFYPALIDANPAMILLLLGRNLMLVGLLVAVVRWLAVIRTADAPDHAISNQNTATRW